MREAGSWFDIALHKKSGNPPARRCGDSPLFPKLSLTTVDLHDVAAYGVAIQSLCKQT